MELFCGIGGFSEAAGLRVDVCAAIDMAPHLLDVYALNFPDHPRIRKNLVSMPRKLVEDLDADFWWMSPPCQPFTTRGLQLGLDDPRARILPRLLEWIQDLRPPALGMENVAGFSGTHAHGLFLKTLESCGYDVQERILCPTELGVPARRERYYLVASRDGLAPGALQETPGAPQRELMEFLEFPLHAEPPEALLVPPEILAKYEEGMRILDLRASPGAIANTLTSAYGKSWRASGSYLRLDDGQVRFFSPREALRLMGFSDGFHFPAEFPRRRKYKAIGNSLSIFAMNQVLSTVLPTATPPAKAR